MTARAMLLQRYEPATKYIGTGEYIAEMVTDTDGECVLYTDYLADRAALLKRIEELEEMNRNILAEYKKQIEELEAMAPRWVSEEDFLDREMDGWLEVTVDEEVTDLILACPTIPPPEPKGDAE